MNKSEFPYRETGRHDSLQQARQAEVPINRLWSVIEDYDNDLLIYGPPCHTINLLHLVETNEEHDGNSYYLEPLAGAAQGEELKTDLIKCLQAEPAEQK